MTEKEYQKYRKIAIKICKNDERTMDLFHDVLIQLSTNQKFQELSEDQRKFFFIRAISNQFYSNNSYFYREYRQKNNTTQFSESHEQPETEYQEPLTMEWVQETLQKRLEEKPEDWYDVGIFRLYIEHKKLETIHRKTTIPKYSLRITINSMKKWLKEEWAKLN